jgi:hypothetical protein
MEYRLMSWTTIVDRELALAMLPGWLGQRLLGERGRFGLLLTTGDVMRITSVDAIHQSDSGLIILDVYLDSAGVPPDVDLAWRPKHFLGMPLSGSRRATVNVAHVVSVVSFLEDASPVEGVVMELEALANQIEHVELASSSLPSHVGGAASGREN